MGLIKAERTKQNSKKSVELVKSKLLKDDSIYTNLPFSMLLVGSFLGGLLWGETRSSWLNIRFACQKEVPQLFEVLLEVFFF